MMIHGAKIMIWSGASLGHWDKTEFEGRCKKALDNDDSFKTIKAHWHWKKAQLISLLYISVTFQRTFHTCIRHIEYIILQHSLLVKRDLSDFCNLKGTNTSVTSWNTKHFKTSYQQNREKVGFLHPTAHEYYTIWLR